MPRDYTVCTIRGLKWSHTWRWHGCPIIRQYRPGGIAIGERWVATSKPGVNSIGLIQPVVLRTLTAEARIRVGNNVGMSGCTLSARAKINIGDDCLIGSGALITDNDAHPIHPDDRFDTAKIRARPITIGCRVFIGARAIILKGSNIEEGSVIGAGAVVSGDVPPYSIVVGNPAKVVGDSRGRLSVH